MHKSITRFCVARSATACSISAAMGRHRFCMVAKLCCAALALGGVAGALVSGVQQAGEQRVTHTHRPALKNCSAGSNVPAINGPNRQDACSGERRLSLIHISQGIVR